MTLATIPLYCSDGDVQRLLSFYGMVTRLDDVCDQQQVKISGTPTSGTYTLTYGTQTTDALAFNADKYAVQAALRNLIGLENTKVTQSGASPNFYFRVKLVDVLGPALPLTATPSLAGGTPPYIGIAQVVTGDKSALTDCHVEATEEANGHLLTRYDPASLATSNWVNRFCAHLSTFALCGRRADSVPERFTNRMERYWDEIEGYGKGYRPLPGVPMSRTLGPMGVNQRVLVRYNFKALRTDTSTSTVQPTTQRVTRDWADAYIGPYEYY